MDRPRPGAHYPRSVGEFQAWFQSDEDCLDYLEWLRWPAGFACLVCGHQAAWRLGDGRLMCAGCGSRTSATAGTIFASMGGSKPAICGRLKTGHFRRPETGVEIYFTASSVGKEFAVDPRQRARGKCSERQRGPCLVRSPGWVPSRTSVLVMPGRGTLARRNGQAGPDGVVVDDESARALRRATTRVPRKARLAHGAMVGTVGVGSCARRAWRRCSRARGPRPDGRRRSAARESSVPLCNAGATGGRLRTPSDASPTRAPGSRVKETCPRGPDCGPVPKRRMSHRLRTGYAPPVDSTKVVRTRVRQLRGPHLSTWA